MGIGKSVAVRMLDLKYIHVYVLIIIFVVYFFARFTLGRTPVPVRFGLPVWKIGGFVTNLHFGMIYLSPSLFCVYITSSLLLIVNITYYNYQLILLPITLKFIKFHLVVFILFTSCKYVPKKALFW